MKKMNIKAMAIDHGEKIGFGFFAVIVLCVLGLGTSWKRYERTPDALKQDVKKVRDQISSEKNVWPATESQAYKVVDFSDKARQLFAPQAPIALARYSFSPPLFYPLYRKDEPKREPTFEPVAFLLTRSGLAPLSMMDAENQIPEDDANSTMASNETAPVADENGEFAVRQPAVGGAAGAMLPGAGHAASSIPPGAGHAASSIPPGAGHAAGAKGIAAALAARARGGSLPPGLSTAAAQSAASRIFGTLPGTQGGQEMASQNSGIKARGVRFIAVRGVFPLQKQIENYMSALHLSRSEAQSKLEITDFVLERQAALAGPDPWKDAKWEPVSIESAIEILKECSEVDSTDPVPVALRDAVITMNLPLRLIGYWSDYATHPKIKDQELKGDAIERQNQALEALDATISESDKPEVEKPRRRGLSGVQRDVKDMASTVKGSKGSTDIYQKMMMSNMASMNRQSASPKPNMAHSMGMGMGASGGAMRGGLSDLDSLVINKSKYLLFRFFDFDVQPGMAYRYRVRLKLRNPNYELTPEELAGADPELANGEERDTTWSNISNPSVVDNTLNYFLSDVKREPYHEDKVGPPSENRALAQLNVFDWDTNFGTVVKDVLNLTAIGTFIGGVGGVGPKRETTVLDLVEGAIIKKKDRKFASLDMLVDVEPDSEVSIDQHPDLKLAANGGRGVAKLGLLEEAVVATMLGEIKMLDPYDDKPNEDKWNDRFAKERADFKEGAAPKNSRLNGLAEEEGGKKSKRKRKKKSALIKSAQSSMQSALPQSAPGSRGFGR